MSHASLYFGVILYTAVGAKVFQWLELPQETERLTTFQVLLVTSSTGLLVIIPLSPNVVTMPLILVTLPQSLATVPHSSTLSPQALLLTKRHVFLHTLYNSSIQLSPTEYYTQVKKIVMKGSNDLSTVPPVAVGLKLSEWTVIEV